MTAPTRRTTPNPRVTAEGDLAIDSLEAVTLGDSTQWIRVRGADAANPTLLLIQQGPGLPMINEARRLERLLGLEDDFTVVYWDQRGCGRSLRTTRTKADITVEQMVGDTVGLLEILRDRFGRPSYVVGFSFGATIAAHAAARRPDLVATLVSVGMDVDGAAAGVEAYRFALDTARRLANGRATRQLEEIGPPPHLAIKQFSTRVRWATTFGGVTTNQTYAGLARQLVASLIRSSDYSIADVIRTVRGIGATQAALLTEMTAIDLARSLPHIDVPVVMVQGRHDRVAPGGAAQQFADALSAPSKRLVWFEHSAHTPHLDEPADFRNMLRDVRRGDADDAPLGGAALETRRPGVLPTLAAPDNPADEETVT